MACHEIAALRLGLMRLLGKDDEAERQHELAELGDAAERPGPLAMLTRAPDLAALRRGFQAALVDLDERVARTAAGDASTPYLRTLLVLTRKVELDLEAHVDALSRLYRDLETMHDFVHEVHPPAAGDEAR